MVSCCALLFALATADADLKSLQNALATFSQSRARIEAELGKDQTVDLGLRLVQDQEYLQPAPSGYTAQDWDETVGNVVRLDTKAIDDLAKGRRGPVTQTGLFETFVPSRIDGSWQPVAVYVPSDWQPHRDGIALVLHGRPQSEIELLSQPYLRRLADATKTALVAPWGRGVYDFEGNAGKDVLDVFDAVSSALSPNPRRTYLAGYSMGGFSVFKIGTTRAWTGVMCISGSMLNSEVPSVRFAWRSTPVYVVNGKLDESIPSIYGLETAQYLSFLGIPVGFYQEPSGAHQVRTLVPALTAAWRDMIAGVVRPESVPVAAAMPHLNVPTGVNQTQKP